MRRIGLAVVLALSFFAPSAGVAQQSSKVHRVGWLEVCGPGPRRPHFDIFRARPAELAYGRAGLMLFYGTNVLEQFRGAGVHIDKILRGAKPADSACGAAHEVRVGHQPQDCQGPRTDDPAVVAAARGSRDRVSMLDQRGQLVRAEVGFATLAALPAHWSLT